MHYPFEAPTRLPPDLGRVEAYWRGLLRGEAAMPFWDDARLEDLPDLKDHLFLIDVFDMPERFRFAMVGAEIGGPSLEGCFLDEVALGPPFGFLRSQCSATVEASAPTFYRGPADAAATTHSRLLLPMWGGGRISMILGVVEVG